MAQHPAKELVDILLPVYMAGNSLRNSVVTEDRCDSTSTVPSHMFVSWYFTLCSWTDHSHPAEKIDVS